MIKKIIFLFLFFSSSFVFAQSCPYGNGNEYANFPAGYPNTGVGTTYYNGLISFQNTCAASQGTPMSYSTGQASPYDKRYYCMLNCSCPVGQEGYSAGADHHGISIMSCRPVCPLGVTRDPNTGICPEASSSSSSSSSSSAPSCDSGFHWDFTVNGLPIEGSTCVPDSSSSSSFSSASSASSASSSVSSPSASSSSSSSSGLTPFQSCELTFGVGNCSAVNENSP
jgi:hypothetical protein